MDKMQKAMAVYVKSISKRAEGADKEKQLPGGHLGSSMVTHGEDFEPDSEFGNCLSCTQTSYSTCQTVVTNCKQPSVVQMSVLLACRRPTRRALRHLGWRDSTAVSFR
jgi:hypothetical protein